MTKSFIVLFALVLVWGISIGGAFAGGVAFQKGQPSDATAEAAPAGERPVSSPAQPSASRLDRGGPPSQEGQPSLALRQPATDGQQSPGSGTGSRGASGRSGPRLAGAIESIEGDTVTLDTTRGPIQVKVSEDTSISRVSGGAQSDLIQGARVAVLGQRGEDGKVAANAILVSPEGIQSFLGSGRGSAPSRNRPGQ